MPDALSKVSFVHGKHHFNWCQDIVLLKSVNSNQDTLNELLRHIYTGEIRSYP